MRNFSVKRFIPIFLAMSLSSCYYNLDLEEYRPTPSVVLNAVASPDTFIMASVCLTTFYTDTALFKSIENAEVQLYINDTYIEQLKWKANSESKSKGIYMSSIIPQESDKVRIEVKSSHGNVWAEDIVPSKVNIEKIEISGRKFKIPGSTAVGIDGSISEMENIEVRYSITFKDTPNDLNYYCIRIEDGVSNPPSGLLDYSDDPVFIDQNTTANGSFSGEIYGQGGRTFSDKLFDGKNYTLTITETGNSIFYSNGEVLNRKIVLYSLSKSYYNYLTSLLNVNENSIEYHLSEYGLYEPVRTFSNVQGGTGMLGASQVDIKVIDLREIFPEFATNE